MAVKKQSETDKSGSGTRKETTKSLAGSVLRTSSESGKSKTSGSFKARASSASLAGAALTADRPSSSRAEARSGRDFWSLVIETASSSERERIARISLGYPAHYLVTIRSALALTTSLAERLFSVSQSTLLRRVKDSQRLSSVTSERLDRLASVANLAHEVFEDRDRALSWLSTPNVALGNQPPIMLCETEIGANQVRRVLHALEWGGVA